MAYLERGGITVPGAVELKNLDGYMVELRQNGQAEATRNRKAHAIRHFFRFLHSYDHTRRNIAERLIPTSVVKKEPRVLSRDEYRRLLGAARHHTRDAAIIELLLQTGLRVSELAKLQLRDIAMAPEVETAEEAAARKKSKAPPPYLGAATVRQGKGGKDRSVVLVDAACKAIRAYLAVRPLSPATTLFLSRLNRPLSSRAVQRLLEKYFEQAHTSRATVHTLRHSFGTHTVANGNNLRSVQEQMGHSNLATTSRYVSLAEREKVARDMQRAALN